MNKQLLALVAFFAVSPAVLACMCPPDMASWLRHADKILVVRVDSVGSGHQNAVSGSTCNTDQPPCFGIQVAKITTVYAIKGSGAALPLVTSGYGGGDCGIALIAGGYYVIFMRGRRHSVGSCNSAGPYIKLPLDGGSYPKQIGHLVKSLQVAIKDPQAPIVPAPQPQQIGGSALR
jgi:hypothetical protein